MNEKLDERIAQSKIMWRCQYDPDLNKEKNKSLYQTGFRDGSALS